LAAGAENVRLASRNIAAAIKLGERLRTST